MKFKDIKPGDTVYIQQFVNHGWNQNEKFFIPATVDRVTKTQFAVGNKKYRKKDGQEVAPGYHVKSAFQLGDKTGFSGKEVVYDQTDEMKDFVTRLELSVEANKLIRKLKVSPFNNDLHGIFNALQQVEKQLADRNS